MKRNEYVKLHALFLKGEIMNAYRYCERVYNGGIESYEQFQSFTNLCQNFVDNCNFMCKKLKPALSILQPIKYKVYRDFNYACGFAVNKLNGMLKAWQAEYDKSLEDAEMLKQMEARARIDHEIAIEYREKELTKEKTRLKQHPIGYNINKVTTNEQKNAVILSN